jgi:PBP1b-binding outer membrane lipoprotein LpoB
MLKCVCGVVLAGVAVLTVGLGGCVQPPRGENNGRVEMTDTTPAERSSPEVQLTAQHEFSDDVAQQLAMDLSNVPELNRGGRVTVVFGDIMNKTGIVPTTEFEGFRTRIRSKLMQSQNVLKNVRFVENRARLESLRSREMGGNGGGAAALDPASTFFLNGEMYRGTRGAQEEVNEYLMSYDLMSADTGEIVWHSRQYAVKQMR